MLHPFFFFGILIGVSTALMASSNTVFNPYIDRGEHACKHLGKTVSFCNATLMKLSNTQKICKQKCNVRQLDLVTPT